MLETKSVRILQMIGSLEMGGSQAMIMNIYRNIDKDKIQFDFILDHTEHMHFVDEIKKLGGKIYIMPTFNGKNFLEILHKWNSFFKKHPEYKILHSHVRSYASLYIPIAKKYGLKTIIHSHSTSNGKGVKAIVKKILQFPLRFQADYLMACSEESGKWLYGKRACGKNNFKVIPNAIDIDRYRYNEIIRKQYRQKLNLENKFVIGHVGRFHEAKNHEFLLEVFKGVLDKRQNAVLILVGDGQLRESIETKIKEMGIIDKVILLGNRNDVPELLQMMDVFVFPSLWEGLPVTVVEAQAAGLHCYVSDNITNEVALSGLVHKLSINQGVDDWVEEIVDFKHHRKNDILELKQSKYNIKLIVTELERFYRELHL